MFNVEGQMHRLKDLMTIYNHRQGYIWASETIVCVCGGEAVSTILPLEFLSAVLKLMRKHQCKIVSISLQICRSGHYWLFRPTPTSLGTPVNLFLLTNPLFQANEWKLYPGNKLLDYQYLINLLKSINIVLNDLYTPWLTSTDTRYIYKLLSTKDSTFTLLVIITILRL